jgi:hypothetical protein
MKVTVSGRWFARCALASIAALVVMLGTARAHVLVLDVCMGACTDDDWRAIDNLRHVLHDEVKNSALVASVEDMVDRLGNSVPFSGIDDASLTAQQLTKELQDGIGLWTAGEHAAAARTLKKALAEVVLNPALVAADATLRQVVQKAYIARSVSLYRLKRTKDRRDEARDPRVIEAKEAMGDMVRMTQETSIQDLWGTNPDYVFQMSRNDLIARGTGTLSIQINDSSAVFYLHPAAQPHKGAFVGEVFPGVYHIFVTDAQNRSRRYRVEVVPHGNTVLNVDWRRDARFEVREPHPGFDGQPWSQRARIGFTFSSFAERRREADYAGDVAMQVPGSLAIVVGRIKWEGKDALIGALYAPEQPASRVGVALGNDLGAARDLAFFLNTDKPSPHVIELTAPPWDVSPGAAAHGLSHPGRWIIIGSGTAAVAIGAILYLFNRPPERNTASYGVGFGVAGATAMGLGLWLGGTSPRGPIVSVSSSRGMFGWAGSF